MPQFLAIQQSSKRIWGPVMNSAIVKRTNGVGMSRAAMLEIRNLEAWYGESRALRSISLDVYEGEVVTLLGRNGAGKSTTLKSIMGMMRKRAGSIKLYSDELIRCPSNIIARKGIAFCPENRGIFSSLTVAENLTLPPVVQGGGMSEAEIFDLFPNLRERLNAGGTKLSGGEQQMLAIGRILRTGARLILLDEPTEGLAPAIVQQIGRVIRRLRERGLTIILVEQNFRFAETLADRHYVIEHGNVVDSMTTAEVPANRDKLAAYLGV